MTEPARLLIYIANGSGPPLLVILSDGTIGVNGQIRRHDPELAEWIGAALIMVGTDAYDDRVRREEIR